MYVSVWTIHRPLSERAGGCQILDVPECVACLGTTILRSCMTIWDFLEGRLAAKTLMARLVAPLWLWRSQVDGFSGLPVNVNVPVRPGHSSSAQVEIIYSLQ